MIGNECTGDLTKLSELLDTIELGAGGSANWVKGTKGPFKISAKIFADQSSYGIKDGRISKLQICDINQGHWGFDGTYVNYDRGWDVTPENIEELVFLNELLVALGDDPISLTEFIEITDRLKEIAAIDSAADATAAAEGY